MANLQEVGSWDGRGGHAQEVWTSLIPLSSRLPDHLQMSIDLLHVLHCDVLPHHSLEVTSSSDPALKPLEA